MGVMFSINNKNKYFKDPLSNHRFRGNSGTGMQAYDGLDIRLKFERLNCMVMMSLYLKDQC